MQVEVSKALDRPIHAMSRLGANPRQDVQWVFGHEPQRLVLWGVRGWLLSRVRANGHVEGRSSRLFLQRVDTLSWSSGRARASRELPNSHQRCPREGAEVVCHHVPRLVFRVLLTKFVAGVVAVVAVAGCAAPDGPVSQAQARAAWQEVLDDSQSELSPTFCQDHAASVLMCEDSLTEPTSTWTKDAAVEVTALRQVTAESIVMRVQVIPRTGEGFTSDLEWVRDDAGAVSAVDPVWWMPRRIDGGIPNVEATVHPTG